MNLHVRSTSDALALLRLLGYEAAPKPYDARDVGLESEGLRIFSDRSRTQGYGVLLAEIDLAPASLRTFARRLSERFHDFPLAFLGVRNGADGWRELLVVRPKTIAGGGGAVSVARLTIDVSNPTPHDAAVINGLQWETNDPTGSRRRIDEALDVERVTRRFYVGLSEHHEKLLAAVRAEAARDSAAFVGIRDAGGDERVALRIVTQLLFCYFLQRKGLLEGNRAWLKHAYLKNAPHGNYYARVLEPLFYEALAKPVEERPEGWRRESLPFLNGGLFERHYGAVSLSLPDEVFAAEDGLLGFLDSWTFTVSEEPADESEIAVDPEMLGKVFEHLVAEENLRIEGTIYTPRPVVQFMCREALVPYLERELQIDETLARMLLLDDETLTGLPSQTAVDLAERIGPAVERIRVIDPAVGSGAFLLGMLTELMRLRRLSLRACEDRDPAPAELWQWKRHAIERSLFGVDVNPTAIELCRLRMWLSLLIEEEPGKVVPLPNLDYRTVSADSLRDFVAGHEVQQTRRGVLSLGYDLQDADELVRLREAFFETADADRKAELRQKLLHEEESLVETILEKAREEAEAGARAKTAAVKTRAKAALDEQLPALERAFRSRDRIFPAFMPAFHAPDVAKQGGWDVVVMNPPYVGRKEVAQRFDESYRYDLVLHYGRTYDLMLHFAQRAFELARAGGSISMIFNDSIFTSTDATDFRRRLLADDRPRALRAIARTRCFENVAVNGGVVVAVDEPPDGRPVRYVENHGRAPAELARASQPVATPGPHAIGKSELWLVDRPEVERLPHRPLFRPSPETLGCLSHFEACAFWSELQRYEASTGADWTMLSQTTRLDRWKRDQEASGGYARIRASRWTLLGLIVDGGQGLATADDRRFLAAVDGTPEAERALAMRERLQAITLASPAHAPCYHERLGRGDSVVEALLHVANKFPTKELEWPKTGLIRTVSPGDILTRALSRGEVDNGLTDAARFLPFEKGDDSGEDGGARWRRDNAVVIDWSEPAVALLRARAGQSASHRRPRIQNEKMWGTGGVTWNSTSSYLRGRLVPPGGIFGHKTPLIVPRVDWLSIHALAVLMNAAPADYIVRTLLGSRMQIEIGDIRRLPVPVLSDTLASRLDDLGGRAIMAKEALDHGEAGESLAEIETEVDRVTRDLYGIPADADLWVVR